MNSHPSGVEAASWAVAAHLAARLDPGFRLIEAHPGGGQYDVLWLFDPAKPDGQRDEVLLNRAGSIFVRREDGTGLMVAESDVWPHLASCAMGVRELVDRLLEALGKHVAPRPPDPRDVVYRTIAAVLARAALFGLRWRCLWGVEDTSGYPSADQRANLFEPYLSDLVDVGLRDGRPYGSPEKYWFLLGEQGQPMAMFDTDGYIGLPQAGVVVDLTSVPLGLPTRVADDVFTPMILRALRGAEVGTPVRSALGLPAMLSAFNRKERLFLFGYASGGLDDMELHAPALRLDPGFRSALADVTGMAVPAHAWAGVDYHLSWLHAAVQWHRGTAWPGQHVDFPSVSGSKGAAWVTGTQEDADLVVAWADQEGAHVVLVEAKGYGAWSNAQATAKLRRLDAIRQAAEPEVDLRVVLTSPRQPRRLDVTGWPSWALTPGGQPSWIPLPLPRLRLATERCGPDGRASSAGMQWRITGPST